MFTPKNTGCSNHYDLKCTYLKWVLILVLCVLTIDTLAFAKLPVNLATQSFTTVFLKFPLEAFSQMDGAKSPAL